jgi:uncharacterized protein (TIGR02444 family)
MIIGANSTGTAAANPFWTFSLALYAQPGVESACLSLQDEHGFDVNLLLYACFAASRGVALSSGELEAADAEIASWRDGIIRPLRELRRQAGEHFREDGARKALLEAELAAERVQQDRLWAVFQRSTGESTGVAGCLRENLSRLAEINRVLPGALDSFLALADSHLALQVLNS